MQFINGGVTAPKGFKASGIHCGIRKNKTKKDLIKEYPIDYFTTDIAKWENIEYELREQAPDIRTARPTLLLQADRPT